MLNTVTPTAETEVGNEAFVRCLCRAVGAGGHGGRGGPVPCPLLSGAITGLRRPALHLDRLLCRTERRRDTAGSINTSGGLVGGTVGYNYQINHFVIGAEADIDWAGISGTTTTAACPAGCKTSDSWLSTIRGRVGYAADRFLPYFTGGAALGNIDATTGPLTTSASNAGWTVGAGLEFAFTPSWSAKAEYLYVNLGKFNCGFNCGGLTDNVSFSANIVRGGINYRF
jgi:opacity protein-like surface antigen